MAGRSRHAPRRGRTAARLRLRCRLTVEIAGRPALNEAAADLLEQIHALGSLSQAARRLRFSYRRAWMLLDAMNRRFPQPLAITATGGKHGGGSRLTSYGLDVLKSYRDLQLQLEMMLDLSSTPLRVSIGLSAAQGL